MAVGGDTWRGHRTGSHGWGVAWGLGVETIAGLARVASGVAVAPGGAEIRLAGPALVTPDDVKAFQPSPGFSEDLDLWIVVDAGDDGCEEAEPAIVVVLAAAGGTNTVPAGAAGDDRVYLGRVRLLSNGDLDETPQPKPPVRYATIAAATAVHGGPGAELRLTPRPSGASGGAPGGGVVGLWAGGEEVSRVTPAEAVARRRLAARGGAAIGPAQPVGTPPAQALDVAAIDPPTAAHPWQVYRTTVVDDQERSQGQLRVELPGPGGVGDPRLQTLGVGAFSSPYKPVLSVSAAGTVTIDGDLDAASLTVVPPEDGPAGPVQPAPVSQAWLDGIEIESRGGLGLEIVFSTSPFRSGNTLQFRVKALNRTNAALAAGGAAYGVMLGQDAVQGGVQAVAQIPANGSVQGAWLTAPIPLEFVGYALVSATATAGGGSAWATRAVPVIRP